MTHYQHLSHTSLPISDNGFYGPYGGAFVPDEIKARLTEVEKAFKEAIVDPAFIQEFEQLMHDYVGRPSALYKAEKLSKRYGAKIYLKREDLNHTGAHKINNAIGMGLLARRMGKNEVIAETGAGQHGVAVATVAALLDMKCTIYMGATDMERQRPNVQRMQMLGAQVMATSEGNQTLNNAVDAALEAWVKNPDAFYLIGSAVGPHPFPEIVAHFQSIISEEIRMQLQDAEGREEPDYVIAAVGGGSNATGAFYHFIGSEDVKLVVAEAAGQGTDTKYNAATMATGKEGTLHGSRTLVMQDSDGNVMEAYSISAGLDYPGVGPLQAYLKDTGRTQIVTVTDGEAVEAALLLTRMEGIIPALESAHALAALEHMKFKPDDVVVVNLSGRGDKDMGTYIRMAQDVKNGN
ncbi:MAG: tryptophan synthase subunit beta [Muribaculaceae bacterium]|nr:tryptophan synthase subunit beta [Muribaculaceae bacterium]